IVYLPKQLPMTELPDERMPLPFGFYGEGDFYTMKGVVEELFTAVGMKKRPVYDPKAEIPYLHPGRQANVVYDGAVVAYLGEVHPSVSAAYGIKERVYIAVIDMPEIVSRAAFDQKYEGIARFPAVSRDLSLVVPEQILAGEIEALFAQRGGKMLENCELFDIYEGAQIRKGYKSLAYKLTFRLKDRTLEESDITAVMKKIMNGLDRMGIELRQ
ncbi:MAG: phenylalanine--tRNA ligase subunit beta, partial [Clostridiales bacterium]|nr:phenylalanine--tRNA ligase subunit beta [Clostridiales bacterium]